MSAPDRFPLGKPPFRDVEAAARLLVEYRKKGMTEETADEFFMLVYDSDAVLTRADEIEAEDSGKAAPTQREADLEGILRELGPGKGRLRVVR